MAEFLPPKYEEGYVRMDGNSIPPGGDRQVLRLKFGKLERAFTPCLRAGLSRQGTGISQWSFADEVRTRADSNLFIREVKGPQSGPLTQYPKMLLIGPP